MSESPAPRIGHLERDHAAQQLRDAAALGRIELDELDERLGKRSRRAPSLSSTRSSPTCGRLRPTVWARRA